MNENEIIFHTPHEDVDFYDSKAARRSKRRRATFVLIPCNDAVEVRYSICNPKDNFSRTEGFKEAFDSKPLRSVKYPNDDYRSDEEAKRSFAFMIGKSLVKSFDNHQNKFVMRKIEQKQKKK